jgi:hypothetical protein
MNNLERSNLLLQLLNPSRLFCVSLSHYISAWGLQLLCKPYHFPPSLPTISCHEREGRLKEIGNTNTNY